MANGEVIVLPADILRWTSRKEVEVRCPYCCRIHKHEFKTPQTAPCGLVKNGCYELRSPALNNAELSAFEMKNSLEALDIKEDKEQFAAARGGEHNGAPSGDGAASSGSQSAITRHLDGIMSLLSKCDDMRSIDELLDVLSGPSLYPQGVDALGNGALSMAACSANSRVVDCLISRDADVNCSNAIGRTPLMEAALWGRVENVQSLLKAGADLWRRDSEGNQAIDFARDSERNDIERYVRSELLQRVEREIAFKANRGRRIILESLRRAQTDDGRDAYNVYAFEQVDKTERSDRAIILTKTVTVQKYHNVWNKDTRRWKTAALLEREPEYPSIPFLSGKDYWTDQVNELAKRINFTFGTKLGPGGARISDYYQCHVETKLIACFVSRHVLFKEGESTYLSANAPDELPSGPKRVKPLGPDSQTVILTSNLPCDECEKFREAVNKELNLNIVLKYCPGKSSKPLSPPRPSLPKTPPTPEMTRGGLHTDSRSKSEHYSSVSTPGSPSKRRRCDRPEHTVLPTPPASVLSNIAKYGGARGTDATNSHQNRPHMNIMKKIEASNAGSSSSKVAPYPASNPLDGFLQGPNMADPFLADHSAALELAPGFQPPSKETSKAEGPETRMPPPPGKSSQLFRQPAPATSSSGARGQPSTPSVLSRSPLSDVSPTSPPTPTPMTHAPSQSNLTPDVEAYSQLDSSTKPSES